jgi:DNA-binding beta-propeller fold protein YncE
VFIAPKGCVEALGVESYCLACCDVVNRGVAYDAGRIFLNTLDVHTIAVDANTGRELWRTKLGDMPFGGRERRVLVRVERNGFIYVMDRATGEVLSATPYVHTTVSTGVDLKTGRPIEVESKKTGFGRASNAHLTAPGRDDAKQLMILVANEAWNDFSFIDARSDAVVHTLPVGKRPRGITTSRGGQQLYIASTGSPRGGPDVEEKVVASSKA